MKFLIDECLHTSLVTLAHDAGHVCEHVNFLGLGGHKDWQLRTRIRREDYTFVTNNRTDFTALYAKAADCPERVEHARPLQPAVARTACRASHYPSKRYSLAPAGALQSRAVTHRQPGSDKRGLGS